MLRSVALIRPDVSEERISSIIRVTIIGELQADSFHLDDGGNTFLGNGVTPQKTQFFIVTAVKISNLTINRLGSVAET
jgi:hypothetical protein